MAQNLVNRAGGPNTERGMSSSKFAAALNRPSVQPSVSPVKTVTPTEKK